MPVQRGAPRGNSSSPAHPKSHSLKRLSVNTGEGLEPCREELQGKGERGDGGGEGEGDREEQSLLHIEYLPCAPLTNGTSFEHGITDTVRAFLKPEPLTKLRVVGRSGAEM